MERSLIVISDLHVGANDEFDIFSGSKKPKLFSSFLTHIGQLNSPVELVIDGDFVDFLQLKPWNLAKRATALVKIRRITDANRSVFSALGAFLTDPHHSLKLLLGNHDPELAFPEVGRVVRDAIAASAAGGESRLSLEDRRTTYNPSINGILAHIEHGNDQDPWNDVSYQKLFGDAELGTNDFSSPPGTQFVYKIMNEFKETFRFVDLLKPEMPAIPLLLVALKPFLTLRKAPRGARTVLAAFGNGMLAELRRKIAGQSLAEKQSAAVKGTSRERAAAESIRAMLGELPHPDDVAEFLASEGPENAEGAPTLGRRFDSIRLQLLAAALSQLARFQAAQQGTEFYSADHPHNRDTLRAKSRLRGEVKIVIFGHTHEALKSEFANGVYVNSGTWANVIVMPSSNEQAMLEWLQLLSTNSFERVAFPTYVKIEPSANGAQVSLNVWKPGENQLWRKEITR